MHNTDSVSKFKHTAKQQYLFTLLLVFLPALIFFHLLAAPHTKIEEAFHIQATHDILRYGLFSAHKNEITEFYHFASPGPVPRTAVGAAVLAGLSRWVIALCEDIDRQVLARAILGLYNALSLVLYAHGLRRSFSSAVAIWYLLFQCSQFHVIYYASRPLSNMFAFGLAILAMRFLLPDKVSLTGPVRSGPVLISFGLLTFTAIVFRSELALLLFVQTLFLILLGRIGRLWKATLGGLAGLLTGLLMVLSVDSQFWQRWPVWPEFDAFVFNVIEGQSSAWGTAPWYFYLLNALPRLLLNPLVYLVAIPAAFSWQDTRRSGLLLIAPPLCFIAIYSFLPHKEWRFIVYVTPPLTAVAALGARNLWSKPHCTLARWMSGILLLSTIVTFLVSNLGFLPASITNYPGAHALLAVHRHHNQVSVDGSMGTLRVNTSVYLGNLAIETGVTRFLQKPSSSGWRYIAAASESSKLCSAFWEQFDYILTEASLDPDWQDEDEAHVRTQLPFSQWETVEVINGFSGILVLGPETSALDVDVLSLSSFHCGQKMIDFYDRARHLVRKYVLRGWWIQLKIEPRIKVLKRVDRGGDARRRVMLTQLKPLFNIIQEMQ